MKVKVLLVIAFCAFAATMVSAASDFENIVSEGNRLHDLGQYDAAIAKYREAEKINPKSALVHYEIGYTYYAMRDLKKALQILKKAEKLNKDPRLVEPICNSLGSVYDDMKMPDSALIVYRRGARNNPKSHLLPFNAAITFLSIGKLDSAKVWIRKAVDITKLHEGSYYLSTVIAHERQEWMDLYSFGMYALLISKKGENRNTLYNMLYGRAKTLVSREGEKVVVNISHKPSAGNESGEAFLMALGLSMVGDSTSRRDYALKDSTKTQQMEFLIHVFKESVKLIADMKEYQNPLKDLYQGLVKNGLVEAFVYCISKDLDRSSYAKWVFKNKETEKKLYDWLNEDYRN